MSRTRPAITEVLLLAASLTGCGPGQPAQQEDPLADYRPRFAELRTALAGVAGILPAAGSVRASHCAATPEPRPVSTFTWASNTLFMMPEQLTDPQVRFADSVLDLSYLPPYFRTAQGAMAHERLVGAPSEYEVTRLRAALDSALAVPWLVVFRPTRVVMAVARTASTFSGGTFEAEAFLVDLRTRALVCSFRMRHRIDWMTLWKTGPRPADSPAERDRTVRAGMFQEANRVLEDSLRAVTGADIRIK